MAQVGLTAMATDPSPDEIVRMAASGCFTRFAALTRIGLGGLLQPKILPLANRRPSIFVLTRNPKVEEQQGHVVLLNPGCCGTGPRGDLLENRVGSLLWIQKMFFSDKVP